MAGQYILQITPLNLVLKEMGTENPVAEWPIQHLRRYGRGRTKFSFEAGDKCKTGMGVYTFNTRDGDQIFHVVDMHARKLSNQQQPGAIERRLHLNSQSFKPLSETRRRAKSEGRLLESSDDSTINEISESMENVTNRFNPGDTSSSGSKNKLSVLDGVRNGATGDGPSDGGVIVRPRSKTDVSLVQDRVVGQQDDHSPLKSMESSLRNPVNSEFSSVETVKAQEEGTGELKEEVNNIHIEDSECKINGANLINEKDIIENIMVANSTIDHVMESEPPSDSDNVEVHIVEKLELSPIEKSESPFEPLLTSEHAAQDSHVVDNDTTDFTVGGGKEAEAGEEVVEEKIVDGAIKRVAPKPAPLRNFGTDIVAMPRGEDEVPRKRKSRKAAQRNKSFEFGSSSEKAVDNKKHSGSFSSFDYRKYNEQTSRGGANICSFFIQSFSLFVVKSAIFYL